MKRHTLPIIGTLSMTKWGNSFFNTRMRASQIQSVLNVIENNYQDASNRNKLLLLRRLEAHCSPYCRLSCSFA